MEKHPVETIRSGAAAQTRMSREENCEMNMAGRDRILSDDKESVSVDVPARQPVFWSLTVFARARGHRHGSGVRPPCPVEPAVVIPLNCTCASVSHHCIFEANAARWLD
jgi:hypothetical protein